MKRQTALIAAFCAVVCLSLLTPISPGFAAGDGAALQDRPGSPIKPEDLRIRPTYPAMVPDFAAIARLRGDGPECDFEPCGEDEIIYQNIGGSSAISFGDDEFGFFDDITMVGTNRFFCRMEFVLGDLQDPGHDAVCTLTLTNGNIAPDCPDTLNSDDPTVDILFTTDVIVPMTNPFNLIAVTITPSMLIDEDFLWVGWRSDDPEGVGASWLISSVPQVGSTEDLFVIPNGDGVCAGDYFWFGGGATRAGFSITVFANAGPPGACCIRDNDIGGGVAECQSEVLRAECLLESLTSVWKPLEGPDGCDDFDLEGTECLVCSVLPSNACDGVTAIIDDVCEPSHNRAIAVGGDINQGCFRAPFSFSDFTGPNPIADPFVPAASLVVGQSYAVCGTSGNYHPWCEVESDCAAFTGTECVGTAPAKFCQDLEDAGKTNARDNEWYLFELTEDTLVTISATARYPHELSLINTGGESPAQRCTAAAIETVRGTACESIEVSQCLPAGQWTVLHRPQIFQGIPCGTEYRIEVTTAACELEVGACCDTSDTSTGGGVEGCSHLAEIACIGRIGIFHENTICADAGCPGVPPNDQCENAIVLSGPSLSVTYDSSFANDTCLSVHLSCPNVPGLCSVGNPAGALPAIRADVYYRYQIPEDFVHPIAMTTHPVSRGVLVLSGKGSSYNSWIVVYGDPLNPSCTTTGLNSLCGKNQSACNQNAVLDPTFGIFKINNEAHLTLPVGGSNQFQPGQCILIRVGGTGAAPAGRGPGQLNIDFIPTEPDPFNTEWGRCCFGEPNFDCQVVLGVGGVGDPPRNCEELGGRPRPFTDFHQGDPAATERRAGCESNPCPGPGDACYTALDFNALVGGGSSGTVTRAVNNVLYFKYTLPSSGGVVIDTCGSQGAPLLAIYKTIQNGPGGGVLHGDCALSSLIAKNFLCTSTFTTATGALKTSSCYGGLNATFNACLCLQVGSDPALQGDTDIYIAIGYSGKPGGSTSGPDMFGASPRDVFDPVLTDFAGTLAWQLNIEVIDECFECPAVCDVPAGPNGIVIQEGTEDNICQDYGGLPPQDLWNGGCNASPPSFNDVTIDFTSSVGLDEYIICGTSGNYRHAVECTNPIDCPNQAPCDPGGFCVGPRATPFVARDEDWYRVIVDKPSIIKWEILKTEFAAQLDIFADPAGDCSGTLFLLASEETDFACEPPDGTPQTLEVSASVCAGTYFVRITQAIFGGLGDTACDARYVVRATQEPFEVSATCCRGDMNADGKLNGLDIQKWVNALFNPPTVFDSFLGCFSPNYCRADLNQDGVIDLQDAVGPGGLVDRLLTVSTCDEVDEGLPVDFVCDDPATSQAPFDSTGATVSDLDTILDTRSVECFKPLEDGLLTNVCWWGTYLTTGGDGCPAEPDCFRITILEPRDNCSPAFSNRCPSSTPVGTPAQLVLDATRATAGGLIVPSGVVQQFFYTAELPEPVAVEAGKCYWIEIVNQTPFSNCAWNWSQSPQGDSLHASKVVEPATGTLPTDYNACARRSRDLAFSINLRIAKDGCGPPLGRCCYDVGLLSGELGGGDVDCDATTREECLFIRQGDWVINRPCCDRPEPPIDDCELDETACGEAGGTFTLCCDIPQDPVCDDKVPNEATCDELGGVWDDVNQCCELDQPNVIDCTLPDEAACTNEGGDPFDCCLDIPQPDVIDCEINTVAECDAAEGEIVIEGTCEPENPECVVGRCCYLDELQVTQCANTVRTACLAVGGLWVEGEVCGVDPVCPEAPCCFDQALCTPGMTEIECLVDGGLWLDGETACPQVCPTGLCNLGNQHCQRADTGAGGVDIQQGGYVSDADNGVSVADDFRPSGSQLFINQVCFRGFHRFGTQDCSPESQAESFRITYYRNDGGKPNLSDIIGGPFNVTPIKKNSGEAVAAGGGIQYTYEVFHAAVAVSAFQCYWIEIQNTTPDPDCVFLWSTAISQDGNNRAVIRKVGGADAFEFDYINRDLAFCLGPAQLTPGACTSAQLPLPPIPGNNTCRDVCPVGSPDNCSAAATGSNPNWLGQGAVDWFEGTTFGATRDSPPGTICGSESSNAPDAFYLWTSGGGTAVFEICSLNTTYNTFLSLHRNEGFEGEVCPARALTLLPAAAGSNCDNDSCPVGLGTNVLFFQGRPSRRQVLGQAVPNGRILIIRVGGAAGGQSGNPHRGNFRMRITQ